MKHGIRLLVLFLAALSLLLCSCNTEDLPTDTSPSETTAGQTDTDTAPDTTMYRITWYLSDTAKTETLVAAGEMPVPPEIQDSEDAGHYYTFMRWQPEVVAAEKDAIYFAKTVAKPKKMTVTFVVDGKEIGKTETNYGSSFRYTGETPTKDGMYFIGWTNENEKVTSNITAEALFSARYTGDVIGRAKQAAVKGELRPRSAAALFLAIAEKEEPGIATSTLLSYLQYVGKKSLPFELTANFFYPYVAGTIAIAKTTDVWSQLNTAEIERLDYIMKTLSVTTALGTADGNGYKTDPSFAGNFYKTWNPNYRMANIPQILFAVSYFGDADAVNQVLKDFDYDTYVDAFRRFGWTDALATWTTTVPGFVDPDGDGRGTYTVSALTEAELEENGKTGVFDKTYEVRFVTPKTMLMEGGEVFSIKPRDLIDQKIGQSAGRGNSIPTIGQNGYHYLNHPLSDIRGIWNEMLRHNYSGGKVISSYGEEGPYKAYIADGSTSPYEGLEGMFLEFKSGERSDLTYCLADFVLCAAITAGLEALDLYDSAEEENASMSKMIWVGNSDLIYKAERGYWSFTGKKERGESKLVKREDTNDEYVLWEYHWLNNGHKQYTLQDVLTP